MYHDEQFLEFFVRLGIPISNSFLSVDDNSALGYILEAIRMCEKQASDVGIEIFESPLTPCIGYKDMIYKALSGLHWHGTDAERLGITYKRLSAAFKIISK